MPSTQTIPIEVDSTFQTLTCLACGVHEHHPHQPRPLFVVETSRFIDEHDHEEGELFFLN